MSSSFSPPQSSSTTSPPTSPSSCSSSVASSFCSATAIPSSPSMNIPQNSSFSLSSSSVPLNSPHFPPLPSPASPSSLSSLSPSLSPQSPALYPISLTPPAISSLLLESSPASSPSLSPAASPLSTVRRRAKKSDHRRELNEDLDDDKQSRNFDFLSMRHSREEMFGRKMTVVSFGNDEWMIGNEVASLLKKHTFNIYRSMKIRGIETVRIGNSDIEFFTKSGAVRVGTHSITLIPRKQASSFIQDCRARNPSLGKLKGRPRNLRQEETEAGTKDDDSGGAGSDETDDMGVRCGLNDLYLIANEMFGSQE